MLNFSVNLLTIKFEQNCTSDQSVNIELARRVKLCIRRFVLKQTLGQNECI